MHYELTPPFSEADVRKLRVNDTVTLQSTLYGIRDATQIHMFDRGRRTRFDLRGHAVIHTAPNVARVDKSASNPVGYSPVCVGTTTSDRMERFTRPLMAQYGVRIIIGNGGTAALETTWVTRIEDVDLDDLNPESLWKFSIRDFGPLLVAMDSHGASLYRTVADDARARRAKVLAELGVRDDPR